MKLKYKKIILLTTMSTMGIGLLTLSITQDRPKAEESLSPANGVEADAQIEEADTQELFALGETAEDQNALATTAPTPLPTPIPTPTPIPVYDLEKNDKMDEFFEVYFAAKASCDVDKLKTMYLDPSEVESREQLQNMVQYIEDYKNIETYAKKSIEEGAFVVYAYHEIKFSSINTLAPSLSKFYVTTDDQGNYKLIGNKSPEIEAYFNARNEDADVKALIDMTNKNSEEAKKSDEDLMVFWNGLDELAKQNGGQSEGDQGE